MKNIPHQINELEKMHAALQVFGTLQARGADLSDDGVVGQEMARHGVYAFRDKSLDVEEALLGEARKKRANQGTRTFARDLRRFFLLLGFLEPRAGGSLAVTPLGAHLLDAGTESDAARMVWRSSLQSMVIVDSRDNASHPFRILLRLAQERPGIDSAKLALALEAKNDSDEEFARVLRIADQHDWKGVLVDSGVSLHMIRNASKVLPALARQLGDIHDDGRAVTVATVVARPESSSRVGRQHRQVDHQSIAVDPVSSGKNNDEDWADPSLTAEQRLDRLRRHNEIVRAFALMLAGAGFDLYEDPYDILGVKRGTGPALLIEGKTLDGTAPDEVARVRGALAQLQYYERFNVPATACEAGVQKVAIFEKRVSAEHLAFLHGHQIATMWSENGHFTGDPMSRAILARLGLRF